MGQKWHSKGSRNGALCLYGDWIMDQRELHNDFEEGLRSALDGRQARMWTALPGIVESFNADALTCTVQPAIKANVRSPDGSTQWVALPLLLDVPVTFPRGGGCTLTFPIAKGDECLVVFSSRCIDAWWQSGDVQVQSELRMHDLSDGFAIPGPFSQATKISGWSGDSVQLRSNDGAAFIGLNPSLHDIDITTSGNWNATIGGAVNINVTGNANISAANVMVAATESASVTAPAITFAELRHVGIHVDIQRPQAHD
jgi:hypothetical protein